MLRETVLDFVNGDFKKIHPKLIDELTIEDIKEELNYWGSLTVPPEFAYETVYYYKYDEGSGYAIEFDLWVDNQQSDLTLSCEAVIDSYNNVLSFKIENLHVL